MIWDVLLLEHLMWSKNRHTTIVRVSGWAAQFAIYACLGFGSHFGTQINTYIYSSHINEQIHFLDTVTF